MAEVCTMRVAFICLAACLPLVAGTQQPVVSRTDPAQPSTAQPPAAAKPPPQTPAASTPPAPTPPPVEQTRIPAKPGETCLAYFKGCIEWCTKNMSGSNDCLNYCKEQFGSCNAKGEWSMDNNTKVIYGMPQK